MDGKSLDRVLTVVLIVVASLVGINAVQGPRAPKAPNVVREAQRSRAFKQWRSVDSSGYTMRGKQNAPVTIAVFTDLQCPACRGFHSALHEASSSRPDIVRVVYLPYPLDYHEHALSGAKASHCVAAANGDLAKWFDVVYSKHDCIGAITWATFASRVGIVDTAAITRCAEGDTPAATEVIVRAQAWANQIALTGTPAILINGHKLVRPASAAQLDTLIRWFAQER